MRLQIANVLFLLSLFKAGEEGFVAIGGDVGGSGRVCNFDIKFGRGLTIDQVHGDISARKTTQQQHLYETTEVPTLPQQRYNSAWFEQGEFTSSSAVFHHFQALELIGTASVFILLFFREGTDTAMQRSLCSVQST